MELNCTASYLLEARERKREIVEQKKLLTAN